MPFQMPLTPSPKPPLFIKAVKDMSSINTFEKLLKLWSKLLTFRLYNTIVSGTTNYMSLYEIICLYMKLYVSIWSIKAVSPLTAHIWVVFSILARRPWSSNSRLSWYFLSLSDFLSNISMMDWGIKVVNQSNVPCISATEVRTHGWIRFVNIR